MFCSSFGVECAFVVCECISIILIDATVKKKNSAPTKTTRKYVTTRLKFKWKIKRGRKKLLKASMRGKIAKTADADAARFFVVVVKCV